MASSRVMAAAAASPPQPQPPASSDLARFRSGSGIGSMSMDDILSNIYGEAPPPGAGDGPAEPSPAPEVASRRTAEEVWKEISAAGGLSVPAATATATAAAGGGGGAGGAAEITLEDFLAREDDARVTGVERKMVVGFPDGAEGAAGGRGGGGGSGRGRKRVLMDPMDRAAMQRQKRMIKNRESAARSRERKQAYIVELEAQVAQLEEEHAQLLREQEERNQRRLELKEQAIAIIIRKKPSQDIRRTNSMEW